MINRPLLLTAFLLISSFLSAQTGYEIRFKNGSMVPEPNIRQGYVDSFNNSVTRSGNKGYAVLQFEQIPDERSKTILKSAGIELLDYLPVHAYNITFKGRLDINFLRLARVRSIFQLPAPYKMDQYLAKGHIPFWSVKTPGTFDAWIKFPKTFSLDEVRSFLREKNIDIVGEDYSLYQILVIRIALSRLAEIASLPIIEYVQAAPPPDHPLNRNSRSLSKANTLNASVSNGGKGLKGEGIVIGVGDNADVQSHIDFSRRLINRAGIPSSMHGMHVSGTVGGGGIINELHRGLAPKSTIVSQYFSRIISNAPVYVNDYGMVITNNSYGDIAECDYHGTYDLTSQVLDQMAFDYPGLSNVFASGNSGNSTCFPFAQGFRTVLGSYQTAKNVITVGAVNDSALVTGFSSKGPVRDGRLKPEITAQGQSVVSTIPTTSYGNNSGTSMASPAVAGGLALLYQRYRQLNGGADPSNALMKAILCNGASDRGNDGPDYKYGFGVMNLLRSVEMLENNQYVNASSTTGSANTHNITVPSGTAQLKVMLYWNDPAASITSSNALVNDLDLEVITPSAATVLPRVLDTIVSNVGNIATTGADHINNVEQVVITNPAAGTYNLRVKGTAINQNPSQDYSLVYDIIPIHLKVTAPAGGEGLVPGELTKISWDAYGFISGTVALEYSIDNGSNWISMATGVDINRLNYSWWVPSVSTVQAIVRITKEGSGESATSSVFTILGQPVVTMAAVQCRGYISINWTTVSGSTDYEVMMLQGEEMKHITYTTGTTYTFSGLVPDSVYWVTVRPRLNTIAGRRGIAVSRTPNNGTCAGSISDNDLRAEALLAPRSGRKFTSSQLSAAVNIIARIRNLDDAAVSNYDVKYSINGGPWVNETINTSIAAGATYDHSFATTADLSAIGNYTIKVVIKNSLPDPVTSNDTLVTILKHVDNQPVSLASYFTDDIETALSAQYQADTLGIEGVERYDFIPSTIYGRMRTFVNTGIANSGSKAFTLDLDRYQSAGNTNYLTGTFNLVNYNEALNDLRLDFQYLNHGQGTGAENRVWIRGNDLQPWVEVYDLYANQDDPGSYKKTTSIELSDMLASSGQSFSTSFQVRWGQKGILPATERYMSSGYSIDDIRIYEVFNDVQMKSIDSPSVASCGLSNLSSIVVSVRNSSNSTITNIPVKYSINNGSWISETIPSIAANTVIQYQFSTKADLSALGTYTLETLVDYSSDSFRDNDTLAATIHNAPVVNAFPYLQDFEANNGYWFAGGLRSSWEYGTPSSPKINRAASGTKAWKTDIDGNYNNDELSYLYSPCFDVTGMTNPSLSFSVALDIEDCGTTLCDAAWVEYSTDGISWTKLGSANSGTNWYNKTTDQLWSVQNYQRWHVATASLPTGSNRLRLRFVFESDPGVTREGIAIDDIHIYDSTSEIYDGPSMNSAVTQTVSGNNWIDFKSGGKLIASIQANNQNPGSTAVQAFISSTVRNTGYQYYHNRNITIKPANRNLSDSINVRFYFTDSETEALINATGCTSCTKPSSAYELGISKYSDTDTSIENGTIGDNLTGTWVYIAEGNRRLVPFNKGYYAEFRVKDFSEFWLNNGGLNQFTALPVKLMQFTAQKSGTDVQVKWEVSSEVDVDRYELELAKTDADLQANAFIKIGEIAPTGGPGILNYEFIDTEPNKIGTRYYRLKIINMDGSFKYSAVRPVIFADPVLWQVYPNPSRGIFFLVYQLNNNESFTASIYDAKGSLVKEYRNNGNGTPQKFVADLTSFASGVYLMKVNAAGKEQSFRLYKQ